MCRQNSRKKCLFSPPCKLHSYFSFLQDMYDKSRHSSAFSFINNINCCVQFACFQFKKKTTNEEPVLLQAKPFTCFTSTSSYCLFSIFASYLIINSVEEKRIDIVFKQQECFKKNKKLFLFSSFQRFGKISGINIASVTVHYYSVSLVADNPF